MLNGAIADGLITPDDKSTLVAHSLEVKAAVAHMFDAFREFFWDERNWFGPENAAQAGRPIVVETDAHPDVVARRKPCIVALRAAQRTALPLVGHIAQLTAQIYASVPGTKHALTDAGSGASVQPTEACFAGMRWEVNNGHRVKRADWSPEMVRVLDAAMVILDAISDDESLAAAHYTDPGDDAWRHLRWCMRNTKYEPEINPLGYLYAQMLVLSRDFHADMGALLGRFGQYLPAKMKGSRRAKHKCNNDYAGEARPESSHIKDVLRGSVVVTEHDALVRAHAALVAAYPPVSLKDRRDDPPHDALQTIEYRGVIVEVQFHFECVIALKKFSHVAYNLDRFEMTPRQEENAVLYAWNGNLVHFPGCTDLHTVRRDQLRCALVI